MNTNKIELPPLSDWKVETLRLTAFLSPSAQIANQDWWQQIVGELPELKAQQRTGEHTEQGVYRDGRLILSVHPIRVEWRYMSNPSLEFPGMPFIGTFPETLDVFQKLMHQWLIVESTPSIIRLAFGAVLLQQVDSQIKAYELLASYLPSVSLDAANSSDFLYQINRYRNSRTRIDNLKINRLSKWSVASFQNVMLDILQRKILSSGEARPEYACHLELDINTAADYEGALDRNLLSNLFDELIDLGKGIAEKGDIRD